MEEDVKGKRGHFSFVFPMLILNSKRYKKLLIPYNNIIKVKYSSINNGSNFNTAC